MKSIEFCCKRKKKEENGTLTVVMSVMARCTASNMSLRAKSSSVKAIFFFLFSFFSSLASFLWISGFLNGKGVPGIQINKGSEEKKFQAKKKMGFTKR